MLVFPGEGIPREGARICMGVYNDPLKKKKKNLDLKNKNLSFTNIWFYGLLIPT